jgi:small subunit ribosomal protein S1
MNIISIFQKYGISTDAIDKTINEHLNAIPATDDTLKMYETSLKELRPNTVVKGKIINANQNEVIIDIGYKAEGIIPVVEFESKEDILVGKEIDVYVDEVENETGMVVISKRKADQIKGWEKLSNASQENTIVKGKVVKKIQGGYLVDIGVLAFLPSSQVDIRKESDAKILNKEIECKVIKIDHQRMNAIVSRKAVIEEQRETMRRKILSEIKEGDVLSGTVKNIVDFGAFVDLGGIDALLHIGDMSWRRVNHPSEVVALEQSLTVKVLKIDTENERILVGLKQLTEDPWEKISAKYEPMMKIKGKVVNILPYGVFVELEPGVEGLLHISEMSWTKKITHPSEILAIGDTIEAVILKIHPSRQEISLGMKQLETNPWLDMEKKYSVGMKINGRVKNVTSYGAFIEIEEGIDGLIHQSDMLWTKKIVKPASILKKGDKIDVIILSIDPAQKRVSLGLKQLMPNPWENTLPEKYPAGKIVEARVIKITNKGVILELEPELDGLIPVVSDTDKDEVKGITPEGAKQLKTNEHIQVEVVKLDPQQDVVVVRLPATS